MESHLQERMTTNGARIDKEAGIIHGVKILGPTSKNLRKYEPAAMREGAPLYEGARVNVDHKGRPGDQRSIRDRIGQLQNIRYAVDGLYGDLQYNKAHDFAESLVYAAEHMPESCGLSHDINAKTRVERGVTIIEAITKVNSVDLVAEPATVTGLFESVNRRVWGGIKGWLGLQENVDGAGFARRFREGR